MKSWNNLFATQFTGVLNDNLLKSLICFISVLWVAPENKESVIGLASAALVLPFILLSPLASSLAKSFSKHQVLQWSKFAEIPIMGIALIGFIGENLNLSIIALFLMGIQSALYSPSKYALIKDLNQGEDLSHKIGIMEVLSFLGVILGALIAGYISDAKTPIIFIACTTFGLAIIGWLSSLKITSKVNTIPEKLNFPSPVKFVKDSFRLSKKYKGVNKSIFALGAFWMIGSMIQMNLIIHCPEVFQFSNAQTGLTTSIMAIGIGLGCFISGKNNQFRLKIGGVAWASISMTITSLIFLIPNLSISVFFVALSLLAFFGGMFKVPLNTWVQQRVEEKDLSQILAYNNIVVFLFILASAIIFSFLHSIGNSQTVFLAITILSLLTTYFSIKHSFAAFIRNMMLFFGRIFYKIQLTSKVRIPSKGGAIIMMNHTSFLDSILLALSVDRMPRFVMHDEFYHHKWTFGIFKKLNMIPISEKKSKKTLEEFTNRVKKQVSEGHVVCIYTEGQISRNGQLLPFKKGIIHLAEECKVPLYGIHMDNTSGTPGTYNTGVRKMNSISLTSIRKSIFVHIQEINHQGISTKTLWNSMKFQERKNIEARLPNVRESLWVKEGIKRLSSPQDYLKILDVQMKKKGIQRYCVNAPNYSINDITGKTYSTLGSKLNSIGRPLPGVEIKEGKKVAAETSLLFYRIPGNENWNYSGYHGLIDEDGFVFLKNEQSKL